LYNQQELEEESAFKEVFLKKKNFHKITYSLTFFGTLRKSKMFLNKYTSENFGGKKSGIFEVLLDEDDSPGVTIKSAKLEHPRR
jgi:hypothetical protein